MEKSCDTWCDLPKSAHGKSPRPANPGSAVHPGPRQLWPGPSPFSGWSPCRRPRGPTKIWERYTKSVGEWPLPPPESQNGRRPLRSWVQCAGRMPALLPEQSLWPRRSPIPPFPSGGCATAERSPASRGGPGGKAFRPHPSCASSCASAVGMVCTWRRRRYGPAGPASEPSAGRWGMSEIEGAKSPPAPGSPKAGDPPSTSSRLWQPLAACPWEKYSPSLGLGFLACKTGAVTQHRPPGVAVGTKCARARSTARRGVRRGPGASRGGGAFGRCGARLGRCGLREPLFRTGGAGSERGRTPVSAAP